MKHPWDNYQWKITTYNPDPTPTPSCNHTSNPKPDPIPNPKPDHIPNPNPTPDQYPYPNPHTNLNPSPNAKSIWGVILPKAFGKYMPKSAFDINIWDISAATAITAIFFLF